MLSDCLRENIIKVVDGIAGKILEYLPHVDAISFTRPIISQINIQARYTDGTTNATEHKLLHLPFSDTNSGNCTKQSEDVYCGLPEYFKNCTIEVMNRLAKDIELFYGEHDHPVLCKVPLSESVDSEGYPVLSMFVKSIRRNLQWFPNEVTTIVSDTQSFVVDLVADTVNGTISYVSATQSSLVDLVTGAADNAMPYASTTPSFERNITQSTPRLYKSPVTTSNKGKQDDGVLFDIAVGFAVVVGIATLILLLWRYAGKSLWNKYRGDSLTTCLEEVVICCDNTANESQESTGMRGCSNGSQKGA